MFFALFIFLAVPLLTSRTPLFISAMILIAEFMAMFAMITVKGFDGNYAPIILICLLVNIAVGIVNYTRRKRST